MQKITLKSGKYPVVKDLALRSTSIKSFRYFVSIQKDSSVLNAVGLSGQLTIPSVKISPTAQSVPHDRITGTYTPGTRGHHSFFTQQ